VKRLLGSILLITFYSSCYGLNFAEIKNLSRAIARDPMPTSGNPRVAEVLVSSFVNIAQQETCMFTWCLEASVNIPVVAGQNEYAFTSDMVAVDRVYLDNKQITSTSKVKLDIKDPAWRVNLATFTPQNYYMDSMLRVIGFDSFPDTKTDHIITVTYVKNPIFLTNDYDVPFDSQQRLSSFQYLLCLWTAAFICYTDNRPTEGDRYYQMWTQRISNMSSTIRLSGDYYPSIGGSNNGK
jgi:hypothetical protein